MPALPETNSCFQHVQFWTECSCGHKKKHDTWEETCIAAAGHNKELHGKQQLCNSVIYNKPVSLWC
jgi:hypothetical protein